MSKKELINEIKPRYLKAAKAEKGLMLNEFCLNTGYNRNYAIQIMQADCDYHRVKREGRKKRKLTYGTDVMSVAIKVWELLEYPCGVRLKPALIPMVEAMERSGEIVVSEPVKEKLSLITGRTLDRRLKRERGIRKLNRSRGTTRHGSLLKSSVPIRITNWNTSKAGFMEMDTVAHNGGDPSGECVYSLDMTEIYSGWSEQTAVMGKGETGVIAAVDEIKNVLPFKLLGMDSDSGSEFVNWHMVRYCEQHQLFFTRSRPDRKNDNAYVEQKNNTHIRKWLGYSRYDTPRQLAAINDLYRNELRLFNNFFRPVMKVLSKEKINNSVCRKTYDIAQTPYQRLLDSNQISQKKKQELQDLYLSLNPVELKKAINQKLKNIKKYKEIKLRKYMSQP
jgi:hypothetical protein